MSRNIDEEVVRLEFDNDNFERNAKESIKTLDQLKSGLNFGDVTNGFNDIDKAAKNVNFTPLLNGAEKVSAALIAKITIVQNLTNQLYNSAQRMVSSLTIDQISAGFNKYEDKTKSVQTIMAATGKTVDEVGQSLEKLNWFTDETSYNFTDMVSNIGKFTSMGIDLDESVTAMEGIATWAALSGQGANEASRAMYNLAQAIGTGAVKLQDWKSIENANMATEEFKQTAIDTAMAMGMLDKKTSKVDVKNFNQTLSAGWFTSDVLMATLKKYGAYADAVYEVSDSFDTCAEAMQHVSTEGMELGARAFKAAQEAKTFRDAIDATKDAVSTGWMNSFEIIFGNYEEARVLWTEFANTLWDIFASSAETRNEILQGWKDLGGRDSLIQSVKNAYAGLLSILAPIKEAFREIFPPITSELLYKMTVNLENFTKKLIISEETADIIKRVFRGLFTIIRESFVFFGLLIKNLNQIQNKVKQFIKPITNWIVDTLAKLGDLSSSFKITKNSVIDFNNAFAKIYVITKKVYDSLSRLANIFKKVFNLDNFGAVGIVILSIIDYIKLLVRALFDTTFSVDELKSGISDIMNKIRSNKILDAIVSTLIKLSNAVINLAKSIKNVLVNALANFSFKDIIDDLSNFAKTGLIASVSKLIYELAKALKTLTMSSAKSELTGILGTVRDVLDGFNSILSGRNSIIRMIRQMAVSILLLAASILMLSYIEPTKLAIASGAILGLVTEIVASVKLFSHMKMTKGNSIVLNMMMLSIAISILAGAVKKLAKLDPLRAAAASASLSIVILSFISSTKLLGRKESTILESSSKLILMAIAINMLASVVKKISTLSVSDLIKGTLGLTAIVGILIGFLNLTKKTQMLKSTGLGLIELSLSLNLMISAIKKISNIDTKLLIKGLGAIGILLFELGLFMKLAGNQKKAIQVGISLITIAFSLRTFTKAISSFGNFKPTVIMKGLASTAIILVMITGMFKALNKVDSTLIAKTSFGLILIAESLVIMSKAFVKMGNMKLENIGKSILMLTASLATITIALRFFKDNSLKGAEAIAIIAAALIMLQGPLLIFGAMKLSMIGTSLLMLAGVLTIFIGSAYLIKKLRLDNALMSLGKSMLILGLGISLLSIGLEALILNFGTIMLALASLSAIEPVIVSLVAIISTFVGKLLEALFKECVSILMDSIDDFKMMFQALKQIIVAGIESLSDVIDVVMAFLGRVLNSIIKYLVDNAAFLSNSIVNILFSIIDALYAKMYKITEVAIKFVMSLIDGLKLKAPDLVDAGFKLLISLIDGLSKAIDDNADTLFDSIQKLSNSIINAMMSALKKSTSKFKEIGENIISGLMDGIKSGTTKIKDGILNSGNSVIGWFKKVFDINSPSKVMYEIGDYLDQGLTNGIIDGTKGVLKATDNLGNETIDSMSDVIENIYDAMNDDIDTTYVITPVLDLSEIQNGVNSMNSMLEPSGLNVPLNLANSISRSTTKIDDSFEVKELLRDVKELMDEFKNANQTTNNNTFNISGADPNEIAERVSQILQKQVERRNSVWVY